MPRRDLIIIIIIISIIGITPVMAVLITTTRAKREPGGRERIWRLLWRKREIEKIVFLRRAPPTDGRLVFNL